MIASRLVSSNLELLLFPGSFLEPSACAALGELAEDGAEEERVGDVFEVREDGLCVGRRAPALEEGVEATDDLERGLRGARGGVLVVLVGGAPSCAARVGGDVAVAAYIESVVFVLARARFIFPKIWGLKKRAGLARASSVVFGSFSARLDLFFYVSTSSTSLQRKKTRSHEKRREFERDFLKKDALRDAVRAKIGV